MSNLYSNVIFPIMEKELKKTPEIIGDTKGYFIVNILKKKNLKQTWHIVLNGKDVPVIVSEKEPSSSASKDLPLMKAEIEDKDLLKLVSGGNLLSLIEGMTGLAAINSKRLKIEGDLVLAQTIEELFVKKAGGVQRVKDFISKKYPTINKL